MKKFRKTALSTVVVGLLAAAPAFAGNPSDVVMKAPNLNSASAHETYGRFIVTYKNGATARTGAQISSSMNAALTHAGVQAKGGAVSASFLRHQASGSTLIKTSRKLDRAEADAFIRQVSADPNVVSVKADRMMHPIADIRGNMTIPAVPAAKAAPAEFTPDDKYFDQYQWHLHAAAGEQTGFGNTNNGGANVTNAWDLADGAGITIAVIDTGITQHPDVNTELADAGYDFISDAFVSGRDTDDRVAGGWDLGDWTTEEPWLSQCTDAYNPPSDSSFHGTHVASTTGAEITNNGVLGAGIAYNAKVLPIRALGHCGGYTADIADAIIWAAGGHVDGVPDNANPAQVINMSLGGGGACDAETQAAINKATDLGAVVVVAAGNSNADVAQFSPASCNNVITVASTGVTSKRAFYSNYGDKVAIAAPGGGVYAGDNSSGTAVEDGFIWQALNASPTTPGTADEDYVLGTMAGTSQASPHVAGTVALMQSARLEAGLPLLTPAEVRTILTSTAKAPAVAPDSSRKIGAGIVDAYAAVNAAIGADEEPCTGDDCEPTGPVAQALTVNVPVTGVYGDAGSETLYKVDVTAGKVLSLMTYGGSGDASLYVSFGQEPQVDSADAKSLRPGNTETVRFTAPQTGTYYIKVVGNSFYSGLTVVARQ